MNKEERKTFDMAKQNILFLKDLELITHEDKPDFILKDKDGCKIGLEHFRADVYRVQDENSFHISGGHTILNDSLSEIYEKYYPFIINDSWTDETKNSFLSELCNGSVNVSLNMRSNYKYEDFLDNLHVSIHGRQHKPKGHIEKSKNYPDRDSYDLMGFLIEVPVPSFNYHFETNDSQKVSKFLNLKGVEKVPRRFNEGYSYQKINGLPITNEIWNEINIFNDIDFVIIETYDYTQEHHGQYFDKTTSKPRIYPAFSFGFENANVQVKCKDGKN